jgi:hypothetical protein
MGITSSLLFEVPSTLTTWRSAILRSSRMTRSIRPIYMLNLTQHRAVASRYRSGATCGVQRVSNLVPIELGTQRELDERS